jgi:hypothetical protein
MTRHRARVGTHGDGRVEEWVGCSMCAREMGKCYKWRPGVVMGSNGQSLTMVTQRCGYRLDGGEVVASSF